MDLPTIPLNDGNKIIPIGFGSGTVFRDQDVTIYVLHAIEAGFRHVDTAQVYANESTVGAALRKSGIKREDLYVTTKFGGGDVRAALNGSLCKLGLDYVDLYLIHNPRATRGDVEGCWRGMESAKEAGLARSIGVSNFSTVQLKKLLDIARIKPAINQVAFHPYNWEQNKSLLSLASQHGIVIESFSGLTPITHMPGGPVDPVLAKISKRLGATPAQVLFSWIHSKGVVIVTTTSKVSRLHEYLDFAKLDPLTDDEIAEIERAGVKGGLPDTEPPWRPQLDNSRSC